ncbi:MAG TPA: ABC transporter substrate-binding protein, partial [Alphaproteobacteria bacterium]|nr:ABC transporter substrate-binding protein [Alphaproteobacteria bacterium]
LGQQGWLRMNHLHPPFDDVRIRQAVLWLVDQSLYMNAAVGDSRYWQICPAVFACGTPLESDIGAEALMSQDLDKARALIAEAGYDGTPVVILQATDIAILNAASLVTAQLLREAGMAVELQAMDWSTLTSRRAISKPVDEGGWNLFHTWAITGNVMDPISNAVIGAGCLERAWFGWPCDAEIERLRDAFAREGDAGERRRLAEIIQERAFEIVTHATIGQWRNPVAYRDHLRGLIKAPVQLFWNIESARER